MTDSLGSSLVPVAPLRSPEPGALSATRFALVVDDEQFVAALVSSALEGAGFETAVAHSTTEAREMLAEIEPDIAIIDVALGRGPSGLDLAFLLGRTRPEIAQLILTQHKDLRGIKSATDGLPGACGFLSKQAICDTSVLLDAVETCLTANVPQEQYPIPTTGSLAHLTEGQFSVLRMIAQGYSTTSIAAQRNSSVSAVAKLMRQIYAALEIPTGEDINPRAEAVRIFIADSGIPVREGLHRQ